MEVLGNERRGCFEMEESCVDELWGLVELVEGWFEVGRSVVFYMFGDGVRLGKEWGG